MCGTERLSAKPGTAVPRKLAFFWQQKKARKENCRCCECSGPRLRGCTPLRTPIRKSEGPMAKRTQYYCPFLTPSALPPLLSREFPRTSAGGRWRPPCQRGLAALADWGIPTGCAWPPIPGQPPHAKRGGLPSSLAPLVHNLFTPPCRGRACPARSLAITTPFILCIVGRGLDRSAGRRGRRPLQHNPQGFSLPQTSAAAWGQAALHPTLPHSVGRAFARNSFTPPRRGRACPARSLAIAAPVSFAS